MALDLPDEPELPEGKDRYYRYRSYAWIIALVLTPIISIVGSGLSAYYTSKQVSQASNLELVKLAIGVLEDPDSSLVLTEWALEALSFYTDIPISDERKEELSQAIRATTGVSIRDIEQHGIVGGENSELRDIGRAIEAIPGIAF